MTFIELYVYLVLIFLTRYSTCQLNLGSETLCPPLVNKVWKHHAPRGGNKAGTFTISKQSGETPTLRWCVEECCSDQSCNVVFMFNSTCFKVREHYQENKCSHKILF